MSIKATTIRLEETLAAELAVVARADGMTVSDVIRGAVDKHVAERRADSEFQTRLKEKAEADRQIFERLFA
jgi:predicted DNA-binding ribbon-helix-helix protein